MRDNFPSEPIANEQILKPSNDGFKLCLGLNKWGSTEWIGKIYPAGTKESKFLDYYVQHFNSIELNATHYGSFPPEKIKKWADKAQGRDFLFCPKFPQQISHYSAFTNLEEKTNFFFESIRAFSNHLGPVFLQVSAKFSPKKKENYFNYLKSLPKDLQYFVELRHYEWFERDNYFNLLSFLKENKIGLIINDADDLPTLIDLTVPKCVIRYYPTGDPNRIQSWVNKIKEWQGRGLKEAYVFFQGKGGDKDIKAIEELAYFKKLFYDQ